MTFLLIPLCFLIDQYTKEKAIKYLGKSERIEKLNGLINFHLVYNEGAFLGFLKRHKKLLMTVNIVSLIVLIGLISLLTIGRGVMLLKIATSLMLGGALGNIYDRVKRKRVIDFFAFKIKPNLYFNLADMFVFIGGALLVIGYALSE